MIEKFCGVKIAFFQWMTFAVPLLLVLFGLLFIIMYYMHKPELSQIEGSHEYVEHERAQLGPWSAGQRNAMIAFGVTVVLWLIPGVLAVL